MSMIKVENLTFSYPSSYDSIFENVSVQIDTDWKLGFVGRNGRGKTTFLNLLMDRYEYRGKIIKSVRFDYFPYSVKDTKKWTMEVLNEVCPQAEEWQIRKELYALEVDEEVLWRPFETLSCGEQTKALLAALFLKEGHFLLIDEPTNHLDTHGRQIVSEYLRKRISEGFRSQQNVHKDGQTEWKLWSIQGRSRWDLDLSFLMYHRMRHICRGHFLILRKRIRSRKLYSKQSCGNWILRGFSLKRKYRIFPVVRRKRC